MFEYIDNSEKLHDLITRLQTAEWIAWIPNSFGKKLTIRVLCLIQIASKDLLACIDPLALPDLQPFLDWLNDPKRLKVLHAAWQDLGNFPSPWAWTSPFPDF